LRSPKLLFNRLEEAVHRYNQAPATSFTLSFSTGTAWFSPDNPVSLDELMATADKQMYEQKKGKVKSVDN
jgi:two-component system, cell cycle response regulator